MLSSCRHLSFFVETTSSLTAMFNKLLVQFVGKLVEKPSLEGLV